MGASNAYAKLKVKMFQINLRLIKYQIQRISAKSDFASYAFHSSDWMQCPRVTPKVSEGIT